MTNSPTPISVDTTVNGRYRLTHWLGRTVLADEYAAHDLSLDRTVVFKALLPELVSDRGFLDRFRTIAQGTANLSHPAIAAVLDWGRDQVAIPDGRGGERPGPTYYLVSEHVEGRSLHELVEANGPMPPDRVAHVIVGTTAAIGFAHRAGIIHGGLDARNVRVSPNGVVKVTDLGLIRALGSDWLPAESDAAAGKWLAPEQFRHEAPTERTDVYQVGLLAYFIGTGKVPYSGPTIGDYAHQHQSTVPLAPTKANSALPKAIESFIGRSMAKAADDRYQTIAEQRSSMVRLRDRLTGSVSANRRLAEQSNNAPTSPNPSASTATPAKPAHGVARTDDTLIVANGIGSSARRDEPRLVASTVADRTLVDAPDETRVDPRGRGQVRGPIQTDGRLPDGPDRDFDLHRARPRRGLYALVILALLAVLAGLLYLLAVQLGATKSTTGRTEVPAVESKLESEARQILADNGLRVDIKRVPSGSVGANVVTNQSPDAGVRVAEGSLVTLEVSTGSTQPTVPKVTELPVDQARSTLLSFGLRVEIVEKKDDIAEQGTVLSQEPRPDTPVAKGAVVRLEVAVSSSKKQVPKVDGKTVDEARLDLRKDGFLIVVQSAPDNAVEKGTVIRTEPAGGSTVAKGSSIVVIVSGGKAITVPSVVGKDEKDARQVLQDLGLVVVVKDREETDPNKIDKVVSQVPADGDVEVGATVTLRIGRESIATTKAPADPGDDAPPVADPNPQPLQTVPTVAPAPQPDPTPAATQPPSPEPATPAPPVPAASPVPAAGANPSPANAGVPIPVASAATPQP